MRKCLIMFGLLLTMLFIAVLVAQNEEIKTVESEQTMVLRSSR
jgi:hypothetical protein